MNDEYRLSEIVADAIAEERAAVARRVDRLEALRDLHETLLTYAAEHDGVEPPDFVALLDTARGELHRAQLQALLDRAVEGEEEDHDHPGD